MRICFISDTHGNRLDYLPEADVICHTGDYSARGDQYDLSQFLKWFSALGQYKARIFIAGNHDIFAQESPEVMESMIPENVTYLFESSIIIDGMKFFGTPWQPIFLDWAFNLPDDELAAKWEHIPLDTDILLTHCPPHNILDLVPAWRHEPPRHVGSKSLLNKILDVNPIVNAFGHVHEGYGEISLYNNITFVNSSLLNGRYELVNDPIIIHAIK